MYYYPVQIPARYKTFITARNDGVISDAASLYRHVYNSLTTQIDKLRARLAAPQRFFDGSRELDQATLAQLQEELRILPEKHLVNPPRRARGHNVTLDELTNSQLQSGTTLFHDFARSIFSPSAAFSPYIEM